MVLIIYPGFKSAFSDVIGYFYISGPATQTITELLVNRDVEKKLTGNETKEEREALEEAADTIVKICGNTSILINQIVPDNFQEYWQILNPLKKSQYRDDNSQETKDIKQKLFELVVTRDNIGEAMWYTYTGILLTSIVPSEKPVLIVDTTSFITPEFIKPIIAVIGSEAFGSIFFSIFSTNSIAS